MTHWLSLDDELVRRARNVMAAAAVVAEGPASNLDPAPAHTAPGSAPPRVMGSSLLDTIVSAFNKARTDDALRDAVHRAEVALVRTRRRGLSPTERPAERVETRDKRILDDYIDLLPAEAARWEGVSPEHIRRLRVENGRDPASGRPKEFTYKTKNERIVLCNQLARMGRTTRAIAEELSISQATVVRDLNA